MAEQQEEKKEVVIKLTEEQTKEIKKVTGKLVTELKLTSVDLEDRLNPGYAIGG